DDPSEQQRLSLVHIRDEFAPIFSARQHHSKPLQRFLNSVYLPDFSDLVFEISERDIELAIKTANSQSASGPDGITYSFLKDHKGTFVPIIHNIYQELKKGNTHRKLLDSRLTMLKKPGFAGDPKDLRPIAVTNTILRVIQRAIAFKISRQIADKITPHQKGFLKRRYIGDCIKNVYNHVAHLTHGWALFVDFEKAYDSVNRKALRQILVAMHFPPTFITLISTMLKSSKAFLMDSEYHVRISRGVPQGSPLSCILFILAIEPLLRAIVQEFPKVVLEAYADDIAIIAKRDSLLPRVQEFIETKAALVGLRVNQRKSCILPLSERPPETMNQYWNSPLVKEFKYLGVILSKELSERTVYASTLAKFRNRLNSAKAYGGSYHWRVWYHKIFAISLFSHLVQFVIPSTELCNEVDTLSYQFLVPMKSFSKEVLFVLQALIYHLPSPSPLENMWVSSQTRVSLMAVGKTFVFTTPALQDCK
ncbi:MAG: RNA-directed DNA polymerase, partial [Pseudothermotoga sp.]